MSDKQKLWAQHYVSTGDPTLAAKLAGYENPADAGRKNLANDDLRTYGQLLANPGVAHAMEVVEYLSSVMRGGEDDDHKVTAREQLRAAELLAKRYGVLNEPKDDSVTDIKITVEYK